MDDVHNLDGGLAVGVGTGLADSSPLPVLTAGGFGASVDAYACETDSEGNPPRTRLWVVSLLGSQQAVKALWAQLVKGDTVALSDAGSTRFCILARQAGRGWRFFRASLPSAGGITGCSCPSLRSTRQSALTFCSCHAASTMPRRSTTASSTVASPCRCIRTGPIG